MKCFFTLVIGIAILCQLSSCKKLGLCKDCELSLQRQDYNGINMKTNGYYFGNIHSDNTVDIYYFYRNGVFLRGGSETFSNAQNGIVSIDDLNDISKLTKYLWGVYVVSGNLIEIESWIPANYGCFNESYIEKGIILNDSTIQINYCEKRKNGKKDYCETVSKTFQFSTITQKPDSTNNFIH